MEKQKTTKSGRVKCSYELLPLTKRNVAAIAKRDGMKKQTVIDKAVALLVRQGGKP